MTVRHLPAIPSPHDLTIGQIEELEARVTDALPNITDVSELKEWSKQAVSLAHYLSRRELQGPIMGAQRRIEARIGQLLATPKRGGPPDPQVELEHKLFPHATERSQFRVLARGLDKNLPDEAWRQPRKALVAQLRTPRTARRPAHLLVARKPRTLNLPVLLLNAARNAQSAASTAAGLLDANLTLTHDQRNLIGEACREAIADLTMVEGRSRIKR